MLEPALAIALDPAPLIFGILADSVANFGFRQRFLRLTTLAIELRLTRLVTGELLGDGRAVPTQLLDDAPKPSLVVPAYPLAHGRRSLVPRRVEAGQPLLELSPLLQERFDGRVGIHWATSSQPLRDLDLVSARPITQEWPREQGMRTAGTRFVMGCAPRQVCLPCERGVIRAI
jgi:hypothetical protein